MKIIAFQIKNYRSIVNTEKCFLSPDYITALIGQNESGKTSVLEALKSFYEGHISDDVLRSDLTFPEIICTFTLDNDKTLSDYIAESDLPASVYDQIKTRREVTLSRRWITSRKNILTIAEKEIVDFYNERINNESGISNNIKSSLSELVKQSELALREIGQAEKETASSRSELISANNHLEELKRSLNKQKMPDAKIAIEQEIEKTACKVGLSENILKDALKALEDRKNKMQDVAEKLAICRRFNELSDEVQVLETELNKATILLHDTEHLLETNKSEREFKLLTKRFQQQKDILYHLHSDFSQKNALLSVTRKIADGVLRGKRLKESETDAVRDHELEASYATTEQLGNQFFGYVPMFEFFEDFSSLLPNKIDLDDLLNENVHVEGYKAARNFLCVAGLNADFFREKNHRILKQKIENLNSEITIDFQDYWRQSVGKNDKIRINFELEHYDNSQPEKSGKPYLEFWVKDKQERLYPKQRSRGVRWFLSFYLELKATAKEQSTDRVMLIDEPGLSLHARAQEDVLKVFEDLREHLQIIYCTHSPNLIDLKKLYRIIAVQRAKESDEKSETIVHDSRSLSEASTDTLSPVYSLMGTRLNDRQFIFPQNNFIVEDTVTFHYLDAMSRIAGFEESVHYIPSAGTELVPMMANIFFGWKISFGIILMDNKINKELAEFLKSTTFYNHNDSDNRFIFVQNFPAIEDLFSTIDFKRYILNQRVGITVKNSEYIEMNKLSRMILVSDFHSKVQSDNTQFKDFDEETRDNFQRLFDAIKNRVVSSES